MYLIIMYIYTWLFVDEDIVCEFENTSNHFQELEQCNENISLPGPTQACLHRYILKQANLQLFLYQ